MSRHQLRHPSARFRAGAGFTLMEMLVTLMLVSFATMLMFQMLGSYRVARERVQAQAGGIDRRAMFQDWFRDSVHGLYAAPNLYFQGTPGGFSATTLNPLFAPEGSPTGIGWSLRAADQGGTEIVYAEAGRERWRLPLQGKGAVRFTYFDAEWRQSDVWPPKLGKVKPEALPALVGLVRRSGSGEDDSTTLVAVLGPLEPPVRLYGEEQLE